jgi:hypothetical protein
VPQNPCSEGPVASIDITFSVFVLPLAEGTSRMTGGARLRAPDDITFIENVLPFDAFGTQSYIENERIHPNGLPTAEMKGKKRQLNCHVVKDESV